MSIKTTRMRLVQYGATTDIPTPDSGQLNVAAVGNKIYAKDSGGDLINPNTPVARTATSDGLTTGIIAEPNTIIQPTTGGSANDIISLPSMVAGDWVEILPIAANGYELRAKASEVATVTINNVAGAAGLELAVAVATKIRVDAWSPTNFVVTKISNVGTPAGGGTPDV